ncbi:hypothetical protein ACFV9C_25455 [Kribbella sp. NPDC059898]|uniref:hypothetical protein n=1 Tax=Kribbella sp. NPDC059898 TaxID=3346995 RepID=UPI00364CFCEE
MSILKAGLLVLLAVPALAACGGQSNDAGPSTTPTTAASSGPGSTTPPASSAPTVPACADVWVAGQVLPADYNGCTHDNTTEAAVGHACKTGGDLIAYGKAWAQLGQPIKVAKGELAADRAYKAAFNGC